MCLFFSHHKETLCDEKRKNLYRLFTMLFLNSNISEIGLYIYSYINFRFIVLILDGKIADRQTNNSSNSLVQRRSLSRNFSISEADQTTKSVCVGCDKFLISNNFSFSTN